MAHHGGQVAGEGRDGERGVAAKPASAPAGRRDQQREAIGQAPAALAHHCSCERQRWRAGLELQAGTVGITHPQRHADKGVARVDRQAAHQRECLEIGTDQDVLAVVECEARAVHIARPTAGLRGHLEQCHRMTAPRGFDRSGEACPARADDCDPLSARHYRPRQLVRIAIHNLRKGVNEVRWWST